MHAVHFVSRQAATPRIAGSTSATPTPGFSQTLLFFVFFFFHVCLNSEVRAASRKALFLFVLFFSHLLRLLLSFRTCSLVYLPFSFCFFLSVYFHHLLPLPRSSHHHPYFLFSLATRQFHSRSHFFIFVIGGLISFSINLPVPMDRKVASVACYVKLWAAVIKSSIWLSWLTSLICIALLMR